MPARSTDAITMLKDDHRKVRDLFQQYDAARDPSAKRERAQEVIGAPAIPAHSLTTSSFDANGSV